MINYIAELAEALKYYNVEYLIIGKGGAILYGYPGTTQDIDIYPKKEKSNCEKLIEALKQLNFVLDKALEKAIMEGKDFIQIRGGPFPLDIVFAPDGIESFDKARKRSKLIDNKYPCASMNDIIASKRAAKRQRDKEELPRLELFLKELEKK
ncbi:MAG: hypothetical protein A2Y62_15945 [Candidatus Fischerbacteria bacterium RBG_13_37_8]|uniref:Uncharacterized protein n=1 Tax=Candidatus Fischerbacteria bacterium RBG_13_37_8 TaxID=1817863 RepID=A0A1F5VV74_9BACT|nr:MAG: hypothetical protein A2Y62_15945 [Candidatus Fischerbacteria bacterium RBG_13_37_8]